MRLTFCLPMAAADNEGVFLYVDVLPSGKASRYPRNKDTAFFQSYHSRWSLFMLSSATCSTSPSPCVNHRLGRKELSDWGLRMLFTMVPRQNRRSRVSKPGRYKKDGVSDKKSLYNIDQVSSRLSSIFLRSIFFIRVFPSIIFRIDSFSATPASQRHNKIKGCLIYRQAALSFCKDCHLSPAVIHSLEQRLQVFLERLIPGKRCQPCGNAMSVEQGPIRTHSIKSASTVATSIVPDARPTATSTLL